MDLQAIQESLADAAAPIDPKALQAAHEMLRARYEANPEDREALQLARQIKRRLGRKTDDRPEKGPREPISHEKQQALLKPIRDAIAAGQPIVALDAEWTRQSQITTEVGLAILEGDSFVVRNLRIRGDLIDKDRFKFGVSEDVSEDDAREIIESTIERAVFLCGHAIKNDRVQLHRSIRATLRQDRVFDTFGYLRAVYGDRSTIGGLNLKDCLCREGFSPVGVHSAGNDAAKVIFLILALLGQKDRAFALGATPLDPEQDRIHTERAAKDKEDRRTHRAAELAARGPDINPLSPNQIKVGHRYETFEGKEREIIAIRVPTEKMPQRSRIRQTLVDFMQDGQQLERTLRRFAETAKRDLTVDQQASDG